MTRAQEITLARRMLRVACVRAAVSWRSVVHALCLPEVKIEHRPVSGPLYRFVLGALDSVLPLPVDATPADTLARLTAYAGEHADELRALLRPPRAPADAAARIAALRRHLGWRRIDMADALGVSFAAARRWRPSRPPTPGVWARLVILAEQYGARDILARPAAPPRSGRPAVPARWARLRLARRTSPTPRPRPGATRSD